MQLFSTYITLYAVNIFNCLNVFVPYYFIKGVIYNTNFEQKIEFNDAPKNVTIDDVLPDKSQESISLTHKVDAKKISHDIKDSGQNSSDKNESKGGDKVDQSSNSGFSKSDPYASLCFAEELDIGEPLQLVYPNKDHTELLVNQEVLKVLENIPKPIYPVGVIGSVNSGKSLLVNLLNDNHFCSNRAGRTKDSRSPKAGKGATSKGFKMASTPEPETYGIWLYSKPVKMSRRRLQERLKDKDGDQKTRFFSLKNFSTTEGNQKSTVAKLISSGADQSQELDPDQEVNVVFIDIEGFSSHKNIYKYDEALFSMVSSICSEVIYLSNKTLDKSDMHTMEELIKSSVLSKISNLYTLYTGKGEPRENREELFEYFLKIFENKNLTFLINEFDYTSKNAFDNLVNLLKAPKRDLSLYEFFLYNLRKKKTKEHEEKLKELKSEDEESYEDVGKLGTFGSRLDAKKGEETSVTAEKGSTPIAAGNHKGTRNKNVSLESGDVKFNSQGYIFHTLFNSVNIATLPSTSRNELVMNMVKANRDKKSKGRGKKGKAGKEGSEEDYVEHLSTFKSELFQRSTTNPLKKYCLLDGVKTTCHMSGRDLAEMVKFTLSSLSLNRFYRLVSSTEELSNPEYNDAFDQYFKVFRTTRLLMIKNDIQDAYKAVLQGYINGESMKRAKTPLEAEIAALTSPGECEQGCEDADSATRLPTILMLVKYSRSLKERLMDVLTRNYENEAVPEDFDKIKTDLSRGLDRVSGDAEEELYRKLRNHCTNVSEALIQGLKKELDQLDLPQLPRKLKFLQELSSRYAKQYPIALDGVDTTEKGFDRMYGNGDDDRFVTMLSHSDPCDLIYEHHTQAAQRYVSETLQKNEDLIEEHFYNAYNRAMKHYRANFLEEPKNYDVPLDKGLRLANGVVKEAHNVMLSNLGEFHVLDYLVRTYKAKLTSSISEEMEIFKQAHRKRCSDSLDTLNKHYKGNYRAFLERYANLPEDVNYYVYSSAHPGDEGHRRPLRNPANPVMLLKFREYVFHLSRSEFFSIPCSETEKKHKRFQQDLFRAYKDSLSDNVKLAAAALQNEFDGIDAYLEMTANSSLLYSYFLHKAKRFAKSTLSYEVLAARFKFRDDTPSPQEALRVEDVFFNPGHAKNATSLLQSSVLGTLAESHSIDMDESSSYFVGMEKGSIRREFADALVAEYLRTRMPAFRRQFLHRYCSMLVLVCSISLMGMSVVSFSLTCSWTTKFLFSLIGLVSYLLLVGYINLRGNLERLRKHASNAFLGVLRRFFRFCLMGLLSALGLVGDGFVFMFRRLGPLFTFFFGFTCAIVIYAVIIIQLKMKSKEARSK